MCCLLLTWPAIVLRNGALLHLENVSGRATLHFLHPGDHTSGEIEEGLGVRRAFTFDHRRAARITALADVGIKLDRTQKGHTKLLGCASDAAFREDVNLLMA